MARKKRDDGRVQVQVDIGVTEDGKRKRKYFYGRTLKEANAARDAWLAEQERRRRVTIADADVTLEEWSAMWLASIEGTTQGTTHKSTVSAVKQQNDFVFGDNHTRLGSLRVADLRPIHMQTYMRSLDGKSRSTISKRRHVLKSILNAAVANDIIQRSPWQDVKAPRGTYTGHRALSESEQRMIAETWRIHRCGVWAMLMLYAGLRKEELAALDVQDVDLAAGEIRVSKAAILKEGGRVKETKTSAGTRVIPIPPQIATVLASAIAGRRRGRIALSAHGEPLTDTTFKRAWDSYLLALEKALNGLPTESTQGFRRDKAREKIEAAGRDYVSPQRFTPHDLRYTYATILYDAGVDVLTAAALLGHDDVSVTMGIYTQLSHGKKKEGVDKFLDYMKNKI